MPSRDDVARLAGVSGATVSYVLNNTPGVKIRPETKMAVRNAALRLRYRPSYAAKSLATGKFQQIGVLAPMGDTLFSHYHERVLRGAWRAVSEKGYRLVIDTVRANGTISFIEERFVDAVLGIAVGPQNLPQGIAEDINPLETPIALVGGGSWSTRFHTFDIDNEKLGRQAAQHLVSRGHRQFLVIGSMDISPPTRLRRQGFRAGLAQAGIAIPDDHFVDTPTTEPGTAYETALAVLRQRHDFTAVFCYNDKVAFGVFRAAQELGLSIPHDLSLIGVDADQNLPFGSFRLATFAQPLEVMGEAAAKRLLAKPSDAVHRFFDFELIEGQSVRTLET